MGSQARPTKDISEVGRENLSDFPKLLEKCLKYVFVFTTCLKLTEIENLLDIVWSKLLFSCLDVSQWRNPVKG